MHACMLQENGGAIAYKAPVEAILTDADVAGGGGETLEEACAVGVRLRDGREVRSKVVVSNATRCACLHTPHPPLSCECRPQLVLHT